MSALLLLNEDYLNPDLLLPHIHATPAPAVAFAWDSAYFNTCGYSLQQLSFFYECLLALATTVTIYHANSADVISHYATAAQLSTLYVPDNDHTSARQAITIAESLNITVHTVTLPTWLALPPDDHRRFFKFWRTIEKQLQLD